ncbi:MAG: phosphatidate cytidylyltransferase [Rhizomicrobium sp.]
MSTAPELAKVSAIRLAQPPVGRHDDRLTMSFDWIARPVFGFLLAGLAVSATIWGGFAFVAFISVGCAAAMREWHRLFTRHFWVPASITVSAMIAALVFQLVASASLVLWHGVAAAALVVGSLCNLLLGFARREAPFANAAGVLYIGFPALALLIVRLSPDHPIWSVILIFLAVWATDTGALFFGKLIGGPRLAPLLSPKKTWAGSVGGLVCAAVIAGGVGLFLHTRVLPPIVFAIVVSFAGQVGDLFESMVKRRAGCKDSGGLIPGHGGALDRIDSILFAAPVAAGMILLAGFDPLVGAHP